MVLCSFNIKIRIKSYDSYINKLNENILKGKDPYINDIMYSSIQTDIVSSTVVHITIYPCLALHTTFRTL